jgi:hypothetical protein
MKLARIVARADLLPPTSVMMSPAEADLLAVERRDDVADPRSRALAAGLSA